LGKVMAALDGNIDANWLETEVKLQVQHGGIGQKYLHATARRRAEAKALGISDLMVDGQVYAFQEAA